MEIYSFETIRTKTFIYLFIHLFTYLFEIIRT